MRYIKPFNENKDNFEEELKDFCETNLAYLLDEGGKVEVHTFESTTLLHINITDSTSHTSIPKIEKLWSNIKDHMIPFLTRLKNNYQFEQRSFSGVRYEVQLKAAILDDPFHFVNVPFKIEDLINDNNPLSIKVRHFQQSHLEDLLISDFQFFIENK